MCLLLTIVVFVIAIIICAVIVEAIIRQIPQPYQSWMWIPRVALLLALLIVTVSFFFGDGSIHMIRVC